MAGHVKEECKPMVCERDDGQVRQQLMKLEDELDILRDTLSVLTQRLEPVLYPIGDVALATGVDVPTMAPMAARVLFAKERVTDIRIELEQLLGRLEV